MQVPGTTVAATDVEGGAALSFTTSTGDVNDLRPSATAPGSTPRQALVVSIP
jgi:hypothetical protein